MRRLRNFVRLGPSISCNSSANVDLGREHNPKATNQLLIASVWLF